MGTMAVGSFAWGVVAQALGTTTALAASAILLVLVAASVRLLPLLPGTGTVDRTISMSWPTPTLVFEPDPSDGPVLIEISYTVRAASVDAFRDAMGQVERSRRRTGGSRWQLYRSGEEADALLESFIVPSWGEYRRQETQRLTGRDREIRAAALTHAEGTPVERHYFPTAPIKTTTRRHP
jgi:hypothetical protein